MPVLVFLEGWHVAGQGDFSEICPWLQGVAQRGKTGILSGAPERPRFPGEPLLMLLRGEGAWYRGEQDPPLAALAAQALGQEVLPQETWALVVWAHWLRKQDKLLFISPERTGQNEAEIARLGELVRSEWSREGWSVITASRGMVLAKHGEALRLRSFPVEWLEGESAADCLPAGPDAALLHRLLLAGQMLLARCEENRLRLDAGRLSLNTPWIYGVGALNACAPLREAFGDIRHVWSRSPWVAGAAGGGGVVWHGAPEVGSPWPEAALEAALRQGSAVIHLDMPATLLHHGLAEERGRLLTTLDREWLQPLGRLCQRLGRGVLVLGGYPVASGGREIAGEVPWAAIGAKGVASPRRFWHRGRFGGGSGHSGAELATLWSKLDGG
ncbi:MAG: hypothetical protein HQL56_10535 [Magnetococcales bacterium]|nr:hypothetical protein [Magnetococcales bacterium]